MKILVPHDAARGLLHMKWTQRLPTIHPRRRHHTSTRSKLIRKKTLRLDLRRKLLNIHVSLPQKANKRTNLTSRATGACSIRDKIKNRYVGKIVRIRSHLHFAHGLRHGQLKNTVKSRIVTARPRFHLIDKSGNVHHSPRSCRHHKHMNQTCRNFHCFSTCHPSREQISTRYSPASTRLPHRSPS